MDYKKFANILIKNSMINPIWLYEIEFIKDHSKDIINLDNCLKVILIYFSLIDAGNAAMSLDKEILSKKWFDRLNSVQISSSEKDDYDEEDFNLLNQECTEILDTFSSYFNAKNLGNIIGDNKFFYIDNNYLYLNKYYNAKESIKRSVFNIFLQDFKTDNSLNLKEMSDVVLSEGQLKAFKKGLNKNLIITGGPGTGKTTSILYILLNLLVKDSTYNIYLCAASGKAATRMKESILNGLGYIKDSFKEKYNNVIEKLLGNNQDIKGIFGEYTIHRLLETDFNNNKFIKGKNNKFDEKSIFIIDEASMIDICLFDNLLSAINKNSRVFILGDKNQLPSVEVGAVFNDLLNCIELKDNIIELDESHRFKKDTEIYKIADIINNNKSFDFSDTFSNYESFDIYPLSSLCPVYFYELNKDNQRKVIEFVINKWANYFYKNIDNETYDLDPNLTSSLDNAYSYVVNSKVLCAENESVRGVGQINHLIKNKVTNYKRKSFNGNYNGQVMIVNTNIKQLDLYNGDMGILVKLKDQDQLYFMVKKGVDPKLIYLQLGIIQVNEYAFYPIQLISLDMLSLAYGITIHKSQGSEYKNILVILPTSSGHPLLNRQILYTAITRTSGNTYILSNDKMINEAKEKLLERDTNIFK